MYLSKVMFCPIGSKILCEFNFLQSPKMSTNIFCFSMSVFFKWIFSIQKKSHGRLWNRHQKGHHKAVSIGKPQGCSLSEVLSVRQPQWGSLNEAASVRYNLWGNLNESDFHPTVCRKPLRHYSMVLYLNWFIISSCWFLKHACRVWNYSQKVETKHFWILYL